MDQTVMATLLAFLTALILAFWNSRLTRKAELNKELRLAVAEFTKNMAIGNHAMSWLTWKAKYTPNVLTSDDITDYEKIINSMFNNLVGSRIIVAALNMRIHEHMALLVQEMYVLDENIARAGVLFQRSPEDGREKLASFYDDVAKFEKELLDTVAELIGAEQASNKFKILLWKSK
jgi:hypothetical protein